MTAPTSFRDKSPGNFPVVGAQEAVGEAEEREDLRSSLHVPLKLA